MREHSGSMVTCTIRATGLFRVALVAELPGKLEPQFRILLILLVVVLRRRAAAAAAAS